MNSCPDARLAGVRVRGVVERAGQQLAVGVRLVRLDLGEQLLDKVRMLLDYCHRLSVSPPFAEGFPPAARNLAEP